MGEPNDSTVLEFTCWCGAGAIYARSGISVDLENAFQRGCIVGAAIVAWGDAMRGMVRRARSRENQARIVRDYRETFEALADAEYSESSGKRGCEGSTIETAHAWLWRPRHKDDQCEDCGILGKAFDASRDAGK